MGAFSKRPAFYKFFFVITNFLIFSILVSFVVRISKIPTHENKWYNLCREAERNIEGNTESICDSDDSLRNRKDFNWKKYEDSKIQGLTPNESALYAFVIIAIILHILFILWSLFGKHAIGLKLFTKNQYQRRQNRLAQERIRNESKASMFNHIGERFGFVGNGSNSRKRLIAQAAAEQSHKTWLRNRKPAQSWRNFM